MIEVAIANEQSVLEFDADRVRAVVTQILTDAKIQNASISIAVVDDATMHGLNRQYLNHDYPTDVLSFVLEQGPSHLDGEVIGNADYARRSAQDYRWPAENELLLYFIHGTLHLVGHNDADDAERAKMRECERHYLQTCGLQQRQPATME